MKISTPAVVIVDYGMGNLFSLERVINHLGGRVVISDNPEDIISAERVILPGVGAFGDGMENLRKRGLEESIEKVVLSGRPLLGICLGMQLLMTKSEEFGIHQGLGIVSGSVKRLPEPEPGGLFYKIPHVGWNKLLKPAYAGIAQGHTFSMGPYWKKSILSGLEEDAFVYFVHSYVVVPDGSNIILAETECGPVRFCSALRQDNTFGCQFHPEVSGETGLRILREFLYNF